jgi:hypothetical protein
MKEHVPIEEQRMDVKVTDTKSPLYGEYKFYHPEEMDIYTSSSRPQSKAASKPAKGGAPEAPATRVEELDRTAFWNLLTPEGLDAMERGYFTPDDTKRMSTMVQQYLLRYYGRKILHAVCPLEWALRLPPEKLEVLCTEDGFRLLTVGLLTLPAIEKMDYVTMTSLFSENGKRALDAGWVKAQEAMTTPRRLMRLLLTDAGITAFSNQWMTLEQALAAPFEYVSRLMTPSGLYGLDKKCFTFQGLLKLLQEHPDSNLLHFLLSPPALAMLAEGTMKLRDFVELPQTHLYQLLEHRGIQALRAKVVTPAQALKMRDHELRLCLTSVGQTLIQKKYATIDQILAMMEKDGIEGRTWHHFYHLCSEEALAKFKEKEITTHEAFAMDYDDLFYLINPGLKFTEDMGEEIGGAAAGPAEDGEGEDDDPEADANPEADGAEQ